MSILTFNMSVANKCAVSSNTDPFQIMPATTAYLTDNTISKYISATNKNILLHMNYITRLFGDDSISNMSKVRGSLRQYVKLANKLGTTNILIHTPSSTKEWNNLTNGMRIIHEELIKQNMKVHLEIPSWSKEFMLFMNPNLSLAKQESNDPKGYLKEYFDRIVDFIKACPKDSMYLVMDTAHLFANGCDTKECFEFVFNEYAEYIRYVHLNGNINNKFKTDTHCPLFDTANNKIKCWEDVANICAKGNWICVVEITKIGSSWKEWTKFADRFGYRIVEYNEEYMI